MIRAKIPGPPEKVTYPDDTDNPTVFEIEGLDGLLYQEILQSFAQTGRADGGRVTAHGALAIETVRFGLKDIENSPIVFEKERIVKYGKEYWVPTYETLRRVASGQFQLFDWLGQKILGLSMVSEAEKKASASPSG